MPKHVCPEPEPDNSKAWLDSYADAMTLLLAFFILLFAFSLAAAACWIGIARLGPKYRPAHFAAAVAMAACVAAGIRASFSPR